jgi:LEA14-like dessication related protein
MNKKWWLYIISIFGAVAYYEYQRYMKLVDSLSMIPSNVKVAMGPNGSLQINFTLKITNSTDKNLTLKSIDGSIYSKDLFIGTYKVANTANIRANQITNVDVQAFTNASNLLNLIAKGNVLSSSYTLKSQIKIGFDVLGLISIPVVVPDTSTFRDPTLQGNFNAAVTKLKGFFKK